MTTTTQISREEIEQQIRDTYCKAANSGYSAWFYVRVWPDGTFTSGCEASETVPESEYYRRGNPYPVTIWSTNSQQLLNCREMIFEWEECPEGEAEFFGDARGETSDERSERYPTPYRLTESLIEDLDWDAIMPDVVSRLAEAGYDVVGDYEVTGD